MEGREIGNEGGKVAVHETRESVQLHVHVAS